LTGAINADLTKVKRLLKQNRRAVAILHFFFISGVALLPKITANRQKLNRLIAKFSKAARVMEQANLIAQLKSKKATHSAAAHAMSLLRPGVLSSVVVQRSEI